jgi:hypothetical protein
LKTYFALYLFLAPLVPLLAQQRYKVDGFVYDEETNKPLRGASLSVKGILKSDITSENGQFSINVPEGENTFLFSFIGYENKLIEVMVTGALRLNITLKPLAATLEEVVVSDRKAEEKLTETETGLITITKKEIENLPYLLGEMDPVRILQLMPGVQTAGEGNTGFYVRGGALDQNLMLLDDAIVYNPSHLFGFFSVFNGSTINSIDLYKGGIPAYYGGRLSSFTKITTRKGSEEKIKAEGGIGVLSTNLLVEGPIKKGKGSFLLAGRRTYIDLFIDPLRELFSVPEKIDYYFYDLNINADYKIGPRDHVSFRSYRGKDDFEFGTGSSFTNTIQWGNSTASVRWLHVFSDNFSGELSLNSVRYDMDFGAAINTYTFGIASAIRDNGISYRFDLQKKKHALAFGIDYTHHRLKPNNIKASSDDVALNFTDNVTLYAEEATLYFNDKIVLSENLELNAGIRLSAYRQLGPFTRYVTDADLQLLDTIVYEKGARIAAYKNAEPRVALRYSINNSSSLKASYDKSYQYMHMAPLSSASLPMDVWVTSSTVVKPQSANQYSVGYFRNFIDNTVESSLVLYYKTMKNQLEYKDGVIIGYSKGYNFDDSFVFGKGTSYGAEVLLKKSEGKVNGTFAYTLSRTTRQFDKLNNGKPFSAKYDRLHDFSLFANYVHSSKWIFSGVLVYGTGNALNLPVARYLVQGSVVNEYGNRNAFRMPAYHRLDLAATYVARKTAKFESAWIFSIYNVYNRRNPYYIYFETEGNLKEYKLETSLKQVSLFPILPSVTYRFKF